MSSAPQPASPHTALTWLIRGTGLFMGVLAASAALLLAVVMLAGAFFNSHHAAFEGWALWVSFLVMASIVLFYGIITKIGYDMFRSINATTIANFAFIFSLLTAHTLYRLLPIRIPEFVLTHLNGNSPFLGEAGGHGVDYRFTLSFIVFLLFYYALKSYFMHALDLEQAVSRKNSAPSIDPEIPEFPRKSPLIEL